MIIGWSKAMNVSPDYILYEISYENLLLYSAATPLYDDEKDEDDGWDESLDANNPDNFN